MLNVSTATQSGRYSLVESGTGPGYGPRRSILANSWVYYGLAAGMDVHISIMDEGLGDSLMGYSMMCLSERAFAALWDNDDDNIWDSL